MKSVFNSVKYLQIFTNSLGEGKTVCRLLTLTQKNYICAEWEYLAVVCVTEKKKETERLQLTNAFTMTVFSL